MGVIVPIVLFVALVALVLTAPRIGPVLDRRRTGAIAEELTAGHGFRPSSGDGPDLAGPPFHYGSAQRLVSEVTGSLEGLPLTSVGYRCRENGSTHFYGAVLVRLPEAVESRIEVRHEPVFHSTRVLVPLSGDRLSSGDGWFDSHFEVHATDPRLVRTVLSTSGLDLLRGTPEPCSWRVEGSTLLLWRSGGWTSAASLLASVRAVSAALHAAAVSQGLVAEREPGR
ncbi:hypothetical protein [Kitasatospora sp. NBC_01266]|uniref:hypothetical protein n=1 Tax=Kitasatospora sp. NBC_01266 TaxID=2903572 RepID=UPI002E32CA78|nr:hypothetical protein [Kitasatospora sp. NBC_01266]